MDLQIDKFIALQIQIGKIVSQNSGISIHEKAATILQFHVLSFLFEHTNKKLSDVAEYLQASLSSTTQLIERMHKAGLVKREHNETDRRSIKLSITQEGKDQLLRMHQLRREKMKKILSLIPQKDINELIRIQEELIKSLKENPNL